MFNFSIIIINIVVVGLVLINLDIIDDGFFSYTVDKKKHCFG